MQFEECFASWLNDCLGQQIPEEVCAFNFNLYEIAGTPDQGFGVELIGAGQFDERDPDWPCDEVWETAERGITIPGNYSGHNWESCLAAARQLVLHELEPASAAANMLKTAEGIGIGFVDGDLEVIWKA